MGLKAIKRTIKEEIAKYMDSTRSRSTDRPSSRMRSSKDQNPIEKDEFGEKTKLISTGFQVKNNEIVLSEPSREKLVQAGVYFGAGCLFIYAIFSILAAESPSYAIHGEHLRALGKIQINVFPSSDFIVDYTQSDCHNLPAVNETFGRRIDGSIDFVFCHDAVPFLINGQRPHDHEIHLAPHNIGLTKVIYYFTMKIYNVHTIELSFAGEVKSVVFGISFRALRWVNEITQVLVLPVETASPDCCSILIPRGFIATVLANPLFYNGTKFGPRTLLQAWGKHQFLDEFEMDISCNQSVTFSILFGAAPGLFDDIPRYPYIYGSEFSSRSSATTVLANTHCDFVLSYESSLDDHSEIVSDPHVYTSYNYPWLQDDSKEFPDCQQFRAHFHSTPSSLRQIAIDIKSLENGVLTLYFDIDKTNLGLCIFTKPLSNISFYEVPNEVKEYRIDCLTIEFCPNKALAESYGFLLHLAKGIVDPVNVTCAQTFTLTDDKPQAIFHGDDTFMFDLSGDLFSPICIVNNCTQCKTRGIQIDIASICPKEDLVICISDPPFFINGKMVKLENMTQRWNPHESIVVISGTFFYNENFLYLTTTDDTIHASRSSISFLAAHVFTEKIEVIMFPTHADNITLQFRLPEHNSLIWITLALGTEKNVLQKFRQGRYRDPPCEYRLIAGPPDWSNQDFGRNLAVFSDTNPFIDHYLLSSLYSIQIPAGCAPTLALTSSLVSNIEDDYTIHYVMISKQEACQGTVIWTSGGYQNPFQFFTNLYPWVSHEIFCSSFRINVTVEIVSVGSGLLYLEFHGMGNRNQTCNKAFNGTDGIQSAICTENNVNGVFMNCTQNDDWAQMGGCSLRIHINKIVENLIPKHLQEEFVVDECCC
ncbi:unnamed protein product, partial [Mesorhabditis belari]|uniref:Uncharacterized protein n=1 Tax=Mesorhabditis belari TaxID=2138241 RepID=A0AAF3FG98_9BILA